MDTSAAPAVSRDEMLARAEALVPVLAERAARCEALRRLPDETIRDFHDAGLFRIHQPARVGGGELPFDTIVELGIILAQGCPSSAWNLTNLASHHWLVGMYPEAAQADIWGPSPDTLIATSFVFPAGRGTPVHGGYLVSGRWPFSSGVDACEWNLLATTMRDTPDGPPTDFRFCLLPRPDFEIHDNWHAAGLRGTGSKDVSASEVFVPEHRTLSVHDIKGGPSPGSAVNPGVLYRLPFSVASAYLLAGVPVGTALGAWNHFVNGARRNAARYSGAALAKMQNLQLKVADARARIDGAILIIRQACDDMVTEATAGMVPDDERKLKYRADVAFAATQCTNAADMLFAASGGSGLYDSNPMQRFFRDVHAVNGHIVHNFDVSGTAYGLAVLGGTVDNPML